MALMDRPWPPKETVSPAFRIELSARRAELREFLESGGSASQLADELNLRMDGEGHVDSAQLQSFLAGKILSGIVVEELRFYFEDMKARPEDKSPKYLAIQAAKDQPPISSSERENIRRKALFYCKREGKRGTIYGRPGVPLGSPTFTARVFGKSDTFDKRNLPQLRTFTRFLKENGNPRLYIYIIANFLKDIPDQPDIAESAQLALEEYYERGIGNVGRYYVASTDNAESVLWIKQNGECLETRTNGPVSKGLVINMGKRTAILLEQIVNKEIKKIYWMTQDGGPFNNTAVVIETDLYGKDVAISFHMRMLTDRNLDRRLWDQIDLLERKHGE